MLPGKTIQALSRTWRLISCWKGLSSDCSPVPSSSSFFLTPQTGADLSSKLKMMCPGMAVLVDFGVCPAKPREPTRGWGGGEGKWRGGAQKRLEMMR